MEFEWDAQKAERNFAKHGIEFDAAVKVFGDPNRIEQTDLRRDYGENRTNTIGRVNDEIIAAVTHTDREGVTRLISARHASRKERKKYHEQDNQNDV